MKSKNHLDPQLITLLDSLRHRVRRYVVIDSVLAMLAIVLSAFWLGLALDYLPVHLGGTEMPRLARSVLCMAVAVGLVLVAAKMLLGRLSRKLPDDSLALLVERQHPQIGGRLVTAVQLNDPNRKGDAHSDLLLRQVHQQAAEVIDEVDPNRVFRWQPLVRKGLVVVPLLALMVVFVVLSPEAFGRAISRLTLLSDDPWPRRADLQMVGVELPIVTASEEETAAPELLEFQEGLVRLPKGSNGTLRIRARADGAELPVVCTVHYRTDEGTSGQTNMRRVGRVVDGFQSFLLDSPPFTDLSESFDLSVRGLDDRLSGFRVEAVQPPAISSMKVRIRYPDYLRDSGSGEVDLETDFQAGLRVREGSRVTLIAASSLPLGEIDSLLKTDLGQESDVEIQISDQGQEAQLQINNFRSATTIRLVPRDRMGISAQAPYRYSLGVVQDQPPELTVTPRGIDKAVTPIARIPVDVQATDDYGIQSLEVAVSILDDAGAAAGQTSIKPELDREGNGNGELDLRELVAAGKFPELVPDDVINLFGEATDAYDLDGNHLTRSEILPLRIVTPEQLLALLERRELALRSRLEQTITETSNLRDTLVLLQSGLQGDSEAANLTDEEIQRQLQLRRLRAQQSGLQANKTAEELAGIATSLDDILLEMINNRVDSVDRRERIGQGVRDPLRRIVREPLQQLRDQITELENSVSDPIIAEEKTGLAIQSAEEVLIQLTAVLDKMLDLESYNEILDIVRELLGDQEDLLDDTIDERKKRVIDLFK